MSRVSDRWVVVSAVISGCVVFQGVGAASATGAVPEESALVCHGMPATLVGHPGSQIEGTPGDDVIVSNSARSIDGGDGNDLICITGRFVDFGDPHTKVFDGAGDDLVDASAQAEPAGGMDLFLFSGSDTIIGGPGPDRMDLCDDSGDTPVDDGPDVVSGGAGDDAVVVCALGGHDDINLGEGDDFAAVDGPADYTGHITAGPGRNTLTVYESATVSKRSKNTSWVIDLESGTATATGAISSAFSWDRFTRLEMPELQGRLEVRGSDGRDIVELGDRVYLYSTGVSAAIHAELGAGDDRVILGNTDPTPGSVFDLGEGANSLIHVALIHRRVSMNLSEGTLSVRAARRGEDEHELLGSAVVRGVGAVQMIARIVRLVGSDAGETLYALGCKVRIEGGRGDDRLVLLKSNHCASMRPTHHGSGGGGNDVLLGQMGDDVLIGGGGNDQAFARGGQDTCEVEDPHGCEQVQTQRRQKRARHPVPATNH